MQSVCTVILNYNNYDDTCECIDSILGLKISDDLLNIIVLVDNASTDNSGQRLSQEYKSRIVYIESEKNMGYAAGNNLGIEYAVSQKFDYICVLNNDTCVTEDIYAPCIDFLGSHKDVGFMSPAVLDYADEKVQSTGGDIQFKKGYVSVKNNGKPRSEITGTTDSDYLGGACLFFKPALVDIIGLIPENYFLFFEETEWCWKAKMAGYRNVCLNSVGIKHKGSASIDGIGGLHTYLMERNRVVFLKRNAPNKLVFFTAVIYLIFKYGKKGIIENRTYFKYWGYMFDGIRNRVNMAEYPFIVIKD